jgi:hypothetical protein
MPNLDFYAAGEDFTNILEFIFKRAGCRVFESYSAIGRKLIEFTSAANVVERLHVGQCRSDGDKTYLQILVPSASSLFRIEKIGSHPEFPDQPLRYAIRGWGLIQLYLGGEGPNGIVSSHTNHFSPAGAGKWEDLHSEDSAVKNWNWVEVKSISSSLNRFVKKMSCGKIGSRPVLPSAHKLFVQGSLPADEIGRKLFQTYSDALEGR